MELDKRSRVWIVTYFTDKAITDDQLPDHCGVFVHAIQNNDNRSVSIFMKFRSLQLASYIKNLFKSHDQLVIKRSNWNEYDSFKSIPASSEVIRHGPEEHNHSSQDQSINGQQHHVDHSADNTSIHGTNATNVDDGYGTDEYVADVRRSRDLKRSIDQLQQEQEKIRKKIMTFKV